MVIYYSFRHLVYVSHQKGWRRSGARETFFVGQKNDLSTVYTYPFLA